MDSQTPIVLVTPDDQLEDVLERLVNAGGGGRTVDLVVPANVGVFLTASEFRELRSVADRYRVGVTLYSDDALRRQLAGLMGIEGRNIPGHIRQAVTRMMPPKASVPWPEPLPAPPLPTPPAASFPPTDRGDHWSPAPSSSASDIADDDVHELGDRDSARRGSTRWFVLFGVLLVGALIAVLGLFAFRPRANVLVTLERLPVQANVTFDLTEDGRPIDGGSFPAYQARKASVTISTTVETQVNGVATVPDEKAVGRVDFVNAGANAISLPAGTTLTALGGQTFVLDAEVTVPAADPLTGIAGSAEGAITAQVGGTAGNVQTGEVSGSITEDVFYSNRQGPTSGGTDRETTVVSNEDVEALRDAAAATLAEQAASELAKAVPRGVVLPSTIMVGDASETLSSAVGTAADIAQLTTTQTVTALIYDPVFTLDEVRRAAVDELARKIPAGYGIDPSTLALTGEVVSVTATEDGGRFAVSLDGFAEAPFTDADQQALARKLIGLDAAAAEAVLQETPGLADAVIRFRPGWFVRSMPDDPSRITFEIDQ